MTPESTSPGGVTTPGGFDPYMNGPPLTGDLGAGVPDGAEGAEFHDADMGGSAIAKSLFQNIVDVQEEEDRRKAATGGGAFRAARSGAADQTGRVKSAISKVRSAGTTAA